MNEKINIAEILKDCPKGTKLYSPICGECEFRRVYCRNGEICIEIKTNKEVFVCDKYGYYFYGINGEVIIFPSKDQRDWSKFQRPFKDGDVLCNSRTKQPFILKFFDLLNNNIHSYCGINDNNKFHTSSNNWTYSSNVRLATEEEKQKLFQAIKANGYKWNEETKTLEELPKFKIGDKIVHKAYKESPFTITEITDTSYKGGDRYEVLIEQQDNFELAPSKFDISILKPFDKVLVRDDNERCWNCELFDSYRRDMHYQFNGIAACYKQCIPYEGNEHLLGTTNDCDEYYKNW